VRRTRALLVALALAALVPACSIETHPTAGVRADRRGRAVILAPRCGEERIEAVQVADLDGPVRWRVEGGGTSQTIFPVGSQPPLMQLTDPLEGALDPTDAYVATVEYSGSMPDAAVEFRPSSLSTDRVIDADGNTLTTQEFADEADLGCIGGWLWVAGAIAVAVVLVLLAAVVGSVWVIVRTLRKAKRQREQEGTPARPDLSGR
jgi:hypothetical protein